MRFTRVRRAWAARILGVAALATGCTSSPTAPTAAEIPAGDFRSSMTATVGGGTGGISVTPVSNPTGRLDMIIKVRLQGGRPSSRYVVQRAGESGRVNSTDGVCQRAIGAPPWSPSDPPVNFLFPSFRVPDPDGPEVTFVTGSNGDGSLDFEYLHPTFAAGIPFDMMVRVVDNATTPSSELRSACFTVTGK
jgi:hypothetical protein